MRQLTQAAARLRLGIIPLLALAQQDGNERGLDQQDRRDYQALPAVSLPKRGFAKADFAARRQIRLIHAPALHLVPIEYRPYGPGGLPPNVSRRLPAKDPKREFSGLLAKHSR